MMLLAVSRNMRLNHSFDFKESLQVVYLSNSHENQNRGFKDTPPDNFRVSIIVDLSMNPVSYVHVLLLMLDTDQRPR